MYLSEYWPDLATQLDREHRSRGRLIDKARSPISIEHGLGFVALKTGEVFADKGCC